METIEELNAEYERIAAEKYPEKRIVFGFGLQNAKIMMIGEAPGGDEEKQGRPFVGKAGKNLDFFLETVNIKREELYISNVVKIRPTKQSPKTNKPINRAPSAEEIAAFLPMLIKEIEIIKPKIAVTLGNVPLKALLGDKKKGIGDLRGEPIKKEDYIIFPLYHPASIIYNSSLKEAYFNDLIKLKKYLEDNDI